MNTFLLGFCSLAAIVLLNANNGDKSPVPRTNLPTCGYEGDQPDLPIDTSYTPKTGGYEGDSPDPKFFYHRN